MTSVDAIQALLAALALGSVVVGGYVAFVKLRPDMNSAAVEQAMEAMKGMKMLKDEVERESAGWKTRALEAERLLLERSRDR